MTAVFTDSQDDRLSAAATMEIHDLWHFLAISHDLRAPARTIRRSAQLLREKPEHFRAAVAGGNFSDHLPVIRRRAEQLRLERNDRRRLVIERLGEIPRGRGGGAGGQRVETLRRRFRAAWIGCV